MDLAADLAEKLWQIDLFNYLTSEQLATAVLPCSEGHNATHNGTYKARGNTH